MALVTGMAAACLQNGAKGLAERGLTAAEILAYYYNGEIKAVDAPQDGWLMHTQAGVARRSCPECLSIQKLYGLQSRYAEPFRRRRWEPTLPVQRFFIPVSDTDGADCQRNAAA